MVLLVSPPSSAAQVSKSGPSSSRTKVVILGTGTPQADPDNSGPAVAVIVGDAAYLVDCGPGVVRRSAAAQRNGVAALAPQNIHVVFITHLHSDHTLGYPDLIFSPWVLGRVDPLRVYGPRGLQNMTNYIEKAWEKDIDVRTNGLEQANTKCMVPACPMTNYSANLSSIIPVVSFRPAIWTFTERLVRSKQLPATTPASPTFCAG